MFLDGSWAWYKYTERIHNHTPAYQQMHVIPVQGSIGKWSHSPYLVVPWPYPRESVALVHGSWHWCLLCGLPGCQSHQGCSRSVCYKLHFKLIIGHHHPPTQYPAIHKLTIDVTVAMAPPPWPGHSPEDLCPGDPGSYAPLCPFCLRTFPCNPSSTQLQGSRVPAMALIQKGHITVLQFMSKCIWFMSRNKWEMIPLSLSGWALARSKGVHGTCAWFLALMSAWWSSWMPIKSGMQQISVLQTTCQVQHMPPPPTHQIHHYKRL